MARRILVVITEADTQEGGVVFTPSDNLEGDFPIDRRDVFRLAPADQGVEDTDWKSTSQNEVTIFFKKLTEATSLQAAFETTLEKIVGTNNLRNINMVDIIAKVKRAVCLVRRMTGGRGTGFMITDEILMTNWHVFETAEQATNATARFNFERDSNDQLIPVTEYRVRPDRFFFSNEALDYAIVAVEGNPGIQWGTIPMDRAGVAGIDTDAFITQRPSGRDKQIAMSDNEIKFVGEEFIQYVSDTEPGSSGSPVFDDRFSIIALHHKGGNLEIPGTENGITYFRNQGVNINAIKTDIKANAGPGGDGLTRVWPW